MSLDDFRKNIEKIKELASEYSRLMNEKNEIVLNIKNLKTKYGENKVEREIFSEHNKRLISVNKEISEIRDNVLKIIYKNGMIISEETKNVV